MTCQTRSLTLDLLAYDFLEGKERERVAGHVDDCADCRTSLAARREEREIVALVLALEPEPALEPGPAVPRRASPILLGVAAAAAVLLLALGPALLLPDYDAPPPAPTAAAPAPSERIVVVEPLLDPSLVARVEALESRVENLTAARASVERPLPPDPEAAVAGYDWDGLAESLLVVNPDLVRGRVPGDPEVLVTYVERLRDLLRVAEAAGLPRDLDGVARDPRSGPLLFGAVLRRAWPEAATADVAVAEAGAREAMRDYESEMAGATTPAAEAAAEEHLVEDLTREVEQIEARYGEPEVEIAPVVPVRTGTDETASTKDAQVLVAATGLKTAAERILRGTPEYVSAELASLVAADLEVPAGAVAAVATQWVRDYRGVLSAAPEALVAAFEADLVGGDPGEDVAVSAIHRLRSALLDTQVAAEERLLRVFGDRVAGALRDTSRPTFFLFPDSSVAPERSLQSPGNSMR